MGYSSAFFVVSSSTLQAAATIWYCCYYYFFFVWLLQDLIIIANSVWCGALLEIIATFFLPVQGGGVLFATRFCLYVSSLLLRYTKEFFFRIFIRLGERCVLLVCLFSLCCFFLLYIQVVR